MAVETRQKRGWSGRSGKARTLWTEASSAEDNGAPVSSAASRLRISAQRARASAIRDARSRCTRRRQLPGAPSSAAFMRATKSSGGALPSRTSPTASARGGDRSEEHTSELQSLMRISYAVFCLKKKKKQRSKRTKHIT